MHKILEDILALQDIDRRSRDIEKQLANIPAERHSVEAKLEREKIATSYIENEVLKLEIARKSSEAELKKAEDDLLKKRILLASAKKEDEFRAIELEINTLTKLIEQKSNETLELLYSIDTKSKELEKAKQNLFFASKTAEGELNMLKFRESELAKKLSEQSHLVQTLNVCEAGQFYDAYNVLKSLNKSFPLIVELTDDKCPCCNLKLSRETIDATKDCSSPVFCENCGRILYKKCG